MSINSALDIYNIALSAAHAKGRVSSLTEVSKEQEVCSQWYTPVLETVQSAARWSGSKTIAYLPLLKEKQSNTAWAEDDPAPGYRYKYGLPNNYLRAWYLTNYARFEITYSPADSARVISTDVENAVLVYAQRQTDLNAWSPQQKMATAYGLAGHISGPLRGDRNTIQKNFQLADQILLDAQAASLNTGEHRTEVMPPDIASRGYSGLETQQRYYYPVGSGFGYAPTDG